MELLVLLLALLAVNAALLLGWGADSREPGYSWDPGAPSASRTASAQPAPTSPAVTRTS